jgi:predicted amidophosphoribosyltransferase
MTKKNFCKECGKEIPKNKNWCVSCGMKFLKEMVRKNESPKENPEQEIKSFQDTL